MVAMHELIRRLSGRHRKSASATAALHSPGQQGTHSPSSSDFAQGNGVFTSSQVAKQMPEALPISPPYNGQEKSVDGLPIDNCSPGRDVNENSLESIDGAEVIVNGYTEGYEKKITLANIEEQAATVEGMMSTAIDVVGGTDVIKQNLNPFVEQSCALISILDEVAKIHPFVQVAVLAFKAVWKLEKTRRDNNQKVIALQMEMKNMMQVLVDLKDIHDPEHVVDGVTVRGRMENLAVKTGKDIRDCANVCDVYSKKKLIVKVLNGLSWESKLAQYAGIFDQRRTDFKFVLSIHTAVGVDNANRTLGYVQDTTLAMNEKVDIMMKMFQDLMSSEERELHKSVNQKGGRKAIQQNDRLLRELCKGELEGGISTTGTGIKAGGKPYTFEDLREDLRADPEKAIEKNMLVFSRKLEIQQNRIAEETKAVVKREGDRVIEAIGAGPHDKIRDPDVHTLWKEMGWRGSTKSRYFVMALRDYYHEKWGSEDQPAGNGTPSLKTDEWALTYFNVQRLQPIAESFDDDASGFITVAEVNAFTTARPNNWSLPHWIAYWAIGWHQSLVYYGEKIREQFAKMFAILPQIHPLNQGPISKYLSLVYQDVTTVEAAVNLCYINETLQAKFRNYVESEEFRLRKNLETVHYDIDAMDTLALITGPGRIGKFGHALLYLLLERHFEIFRIGQHHVIHHNELWDAAASIGYVMQAMRERHDMLESIFKQQRLDPKQHFTTFAHGMFQYLNNPDGLWAPEIVKNMDFTDYPYDDKLEKQGVKIQDILNYPVDEDVLDTDAYALPSSFDDPRGSSITAPKDVGLGIVLGTWNGYLYRDVSPTLPCRGMLSMTLRLKSEAVQTLHFEGFSRSNLGDFTVSGECVRDLANDSLIFIMKREFVAHYPTQHWRGHLDITTETISGTWGTDLDQLAHFGTFVLKRTAPEDLRFRPSSATLETKGVRSLWKFAISAVLSRVRRQLWSWSHFKERRDNRKKFMKLYIRNGFFGRPLEMDELKEFRRVRRTLTSADSRFYHSLANLEVRNTINHLGVRCINCHGAIGGARIICLVCQMDHKMDMVDLCNEPDCLSASIERPKIPMPHLPTHEVVKVRRVVHIRQFGRLYRGAMQGLKHARTTLSIDGTSTPDTEAEYDSDYSSQVIEAAPKLGRCHSCIACGDKIALPCWYYIHRNVDTFICDKCEAMRETTAQTYTEADDLVRCQLSTLDSGVSKKERLEDLEEQLVTVEKGIRHIDSKVDDRLHKLQELLNSVLEKMKE